MDQAKSAAELGATQIAIGLLELGWWRSALLICGVILATVGFPEGDPLFAIGMIVISAIRIAVFVVGAVFSYMAYDLFMVSMTGRKATTIKSGNDSAAPNRIAAFVLSTVYAFGVALIGFSWFARLGPWNINDPMGILGGKTWASMIGCG